MQHNWTPIDRYESCDVCLVCGKSRAEHESVANTRQVGGTHYKFSVQHWDYVWSNDLDYFQGQITKYIARWKNKGGLADLEKARHFLDKYIELAQSDSGEPRGKGYVDQD